MVRFLQSMAVVVFLAWPNSAQAVSAWYIADVNQAGSVSPGLVLVQLSHTAGSPAFTNKFFTASSGIAKEMLATFLTALAAGLQVQVLVDLAAPGLPPLEVVYLRK